MKNIPQLGRAELAILQHVIDNHPVSVREVANHVSETTGQARTTVLTLMERLREKGVLKRRKVKGVNRYSPRIDKAELMDALVGDFVEGVLGGSVSPFFAYLSNSQELTDEEIIELRKLARNMPTKPRRTE